MSDTFQKRLTSSLGIAVIFMMAFGVLWQALPVPIAHAAAGGPFDPILLDDDANGKIDRIEWSVANPGLETWSLTGSLPYGVSVTYDGSPVTVTGVTITSAADANPLLMRATINESDVPYDTSNGYIELIYTQGNAGTNCTTEDCISGSTIEMGAIATGDSGPSDIESDNAAPVIVSAVYLDSAVADGTVDTIRTTWSENVTKDADADAFDFIIAGGTITAAFSPSGADLGGDAIIDIAVTADALETGVNGGTEPTILYAIGIQDPVYDQGGIPIAAVANGAGAITVTDSAAPFMFSQSYDDIEIVDGTIDRVYMRFTENIAYDECDPADYIFAGADAGTIAVTACATAGQYLRLSISNAPAKDTNLTITLEYDKDAGTTDSLDDESNNAVGDITAVSLADAAAPLISYADYYDIDLDGKIDRITLTFTETLDASSELGQDELLLGAGDFTGAEFDGTSGDLLGAVSSVDINITESTEVDTYSTAAMTLSTVGTFSITDGINAYTTAEEQTLVTFRDYAKPVIKTVTPTDGSTAQSRTNSVVYTFSEPMVADTWVEATEFTATPHGSGWSGTWSGTGNLTMALTHSPFLCVQAYSVAFDTAQIAATNGESGYTALNNASTAPIGATHTFTTMSCSSGSSSSYVAPVVDEEEEDVVADDEEETTDETVADDEVAEETPTTGEQTYSPVTGELEDISVVEAGDFIKSPYFATVYYVTTELTRRPFMNSQTFFTYADSFAEVKTVTDATLTTLPLGSPMLPNPGVVLVKIQSDPKVYAIDTNNNLRWISSEEVAESGYGINWADYIIDIEPTFFTKFGIGADIDSVSGVTQTAGMKTRAELQ
ncbi:MAG: Ig-like domain-containing protein [Patescibacteria group bacterium]